MSEAHHTHNAIPGGPKAHLGVLRVPSLALVEVVKLVLREGKLPRWAVRERPRGGGGERGQGEGAVGGEREAKGRGRWLGVRAVMGGLAFAAACGCGPK